MKPRKTKTKTAYKIRFSNSYSFAARSRRDYVDLEAKNRTEALRAFRGWLSDEGREWWVKNPQLVRVVTREVVLEEKVLVG